MTQIPSAQLDKLELISFKLCPFVQRAVIVLKEKGVEFDMTYIDLSKPPEWFKAISPLGQVPVLKVGDEVLFESAAIQEYVDEITPPSLQPHDPLIKAKNRAWISFGSDILAAMHAMNMAKDAVAFTEKEALIKQKLSQLEAAHSGEKGFNGRTFNLIDAAFAPMMMRFEFVKQLTGNDLLAEFPRLAKWSDYLLSFNSVQESVVPGFIKNYQHMIEHMDGYLATQLKK